MASIRDVANRAGVSIATVSYVLNGSRSVSEALAERVQNAAAELGYRPNRSARALRSGRSHALALIVPDLANPFFHGIARAVVLVARSLGYLALLFDSEDDPESDCENLSYLSSYGVDGAIWAPVPNGLQCALTTPTVTIDRRPTTMREIDLIATDHMLGGRLVAEHAIALGHRHVGLLSGPSASEPARLRRQGFLEAAAERCTIAWDLEVPVIADADFPGEAREALLSGEASFVFAATDWAAAGAMRTLRTAGIAIPEQVSVCGYDGTMPFNLLSPSLSTVRQPVEDISRRAVELLLERIKNPAMPIQDVILPVSLLARESTAAAPNQS